VTAIPAKGCIINDLKNVRLFYTAFFQFTAPYKSTARNDFVFEENGRRRVFLQPIHLKQRNPMMQHPTVTQLFI